MSLVKYRITRERNHKPHEFLVQILLPGMENYQDFVSKERTAAWYPNIGYAHRCVADEYPHAEYVDAHDNELPKPLDKTEQAALVKLFQAFLALPNAKELTLSFYANTGGTIKQDGATIYDEKIILHWHDLVEGVKAIEAYAEGDEHE